MKKCYNFAICPSKVKGWKLILRGRVLSLWGNSLENLGEISIPVVLLSILELFGKCRQASVYKWCAKSASSWWVVYIGGGRNSIWPGGTSQTLQSQIWKCPSIFEYFRPKISALPSTLGCFASKISSKNSSLSCSKLESWRFALHLCAWATLYLLILARAKKHFRRKIKPIFWSQKTPKKNPKLKNPSKFWNRT